MNGLETLLMVAFVTSYPGFRPPPDGCQVVNFGNILEESSPGDVIVFGVVFVTS